MIIFHYKFTINMKFTRYFLTLLGMMALQTIGRASEMQTCIDLCNSCKGTASFEDNACKCHVADDNQRGAECIWRIKRQAGDLGMDVVSCDLADVDINRPARCLLSPGRSFRTRSDADLMAKYFMGNGYGGGLSSLLGSANPQSTNANSSPGELVSSSVTTSESDSTMVGAPHQNHVGNSMPTNAYTVYSMQPAGPMLGISPYSYLVGGSSNSYVDNYNTMVGAQNPQFTEYSEQNHPASLTEDGSQITGIAAAKSSSLDESGSENAEETNLGSANDSNILDVVDDLVSKNEEETIVGSEQTERKDDALDSLNFSPAEKQSIDEGEKHVGIKRRNIRLNKRVIR